MNKLKMAKTYLKDKLNVYENACFVLHFVFRDP